MTLTFRGDDPKARVVVHHHLSPFDLVDAVMTCCADPALPVDVDELDSKAAVAQAATNALIKYGQDAYLAPLGDSSLRDHVRLRVAQVIGKQHALVLLGEAPARDTLASDTVPTDADSDDDDPTTGGLR